MNSSMICCTMNTSTLPYWCPHDSIKQASKSDILGTSGRMQVYLSAWKIHEHSISLAKHSFMLNPADGVHNTKFYACREQCLAGLHFRMNRFAWHIITCKCAMLSGSKLFRKTWAERWDMMLCHARLGYCMKSEAPHWVYNSAWFMTSALDWSSRNLYSLCPMHAWQGRKEVDEGWKGLIPAQPFPPWWPWTSSGPLCFCLSGLKTSWPE